MKVNAPPPPPHPTPSPMMYHIKSMPTQNPSLNMLPTVNAWHQRSRFCLEPTWTLIHPPTPPHPIASKWLASASTKKTVKIGSGFHPTSINIYKLYINTKPTSSSWCFPANHATLAGYLGVLERFFTHGASCTAKAHVSNVLMLSNRLA